MAEKKLKIGLELDDKAFGAAVKRMQDQLMQIQSGPALIQQQRQISQKMQSLGMGAMPGVPTDRDMQKTRNDAKQQSDKLFKDTVSNMAVIKSAQKELNKELENSLNTEEKKLKIRERLKELQKDEARVTGQLKTLSRQDEISPATMLKTGAAISGLIATIGRAVGAIGKLPIEAASAQGSANTSLVGNQLKEMLDPYHQAFMPERAKAMDMAKKAWKAQRGEDAATNAAGGIAAAIGMMGVGMAAMGTGIGFIPGAAMTAGGIATMLSSPKQRAMFTGNQEAYEKLSAKDLADMTNESIKAQEEANPLKKIAAEYNAQNYQRNLGMQRGLGLSDREFMGKSGFLQGNMAYGGNMQFTEEQVTQMQQSLMSAGGSARIGRQAGFGLELQKNLNLTNAPQLLAGVSKTMGGAQETKDASVRIITEAFRQGLNDSDLVDLLRTFTQTTGEIVARSGARSQEDVSRISAQFGKGAVEQTGVGMEAAKTAYDAYQRVSGQTGGPLSVMQRAAMLRNPILKRMAGMGEAGALVFEKLKQIPQDQLNEDHPAVQAAVYMYNKNLKPGDKPISAQDLIAAQLSTVSAGASISGSFAKNKAIVDKFQSSGTKITSENIKSGKVPSDVAQAARMMAIAATTNGVGSATELTRGQDIMSYGAQYTGAMKEQMGPSEALKVGGKAADQVNANIAAGQQVFVDNFERFRDNIIPAANNIDELTKKLVLLGQVASDIASGKKSSSELSKAATSLLGTQPQADSSSGARR